MRSMPIRKGTAAISDIRYEVIRKHRTITQTNASMRLGRFSKMENQSNAPPQRFSVHGDG